MYRLVVLSIAAATVLAADLNKKDCARMFHPVSTNTTTSEARAISCCKKTAEVKDKFMSDDIKECFQLPRDPISCQHELCIAQKKGFATDDGRLDKKKLEEAMTKDVEDKDLLEDLKNNCINGDVEKYGPPDFCDFVKMRHCSSMNILNHCPEWNDFADCKDLKAVVADCVKLMA